MKTTKEFKKFISEITVGIFLVTSLNPVPAFTSTGENDIIYPLKEISKLECRYDDFSELNSNCKQKLPILKTKDYSMYAIKNWGYNDFTRIYTMLWWASYKYWWDVWNWGHMWIDIATSKWTPIYAITNWTVIIAKELVDLWNTVSIEHKINWKKVVSNYSHMSKILVSKWDKIKTWKKIWEVWSTWNSTWNHLHLQIDINSSFHPTYYNYSSCPYSYYEISENWACINELKQITVDPLLLIETNWKILNNIKTTSISWDNFEKENKTNNNINSNIFKKTVYIWYSTSDTKEVQKLFTLLWYYNWKISWNYNEIINNIIDYQLDTKVINNKNDDWAWWFWPKTRAQAKKDYDKLESKTLTLNTKSKTNNTSNNTQIETKKISREKLLTRKEIEKREVNEFINNYNIELQFVNPWGNIEKWKSELLKLKILDKKGKLFKWNMPSWMTFIVDESKISVFPKKLYYFKNWKRDIILTGLKEWNTNLYIKIGNEKIKTIPLKIYKSWAEIKPEKSIILWTDKIILWEKKTWIIVFRDNNWKNLINIEYNADITLQTSEDLQICIKTWNIKSIRNIYKTNCWDEEFVDYKNITYKDTVWWLLIYDYKVSWNSANIDIINNNTKKTINSKKITVSNPKWLNLAYEYKNEVIEMLEKWVVNWIKKWYFLEKRELTEYDALSWIRNTLINMNEDSQYNNKKNEIENNLRNVFAKRKNSSHFTSINRKQLLNLVYEYLIFDKNNTWIKKEYIDLENNDNQKASKVFDKNITWKDKFWENYFRPAVKVTRWEWAYILSKVINKNEQLYITKK